MNNIQIEVRIKELMDTFKIGGNECSEIVGLAYGTFRKCISLTVNSHNFKDVHLEKLIDYIKNVYVPNLVEEAQKL